MRCVNHCSLFLLTFYTAPQLFGIGVVNGHLDGIMQITNWGECLLFLTLWDNIICDTYSKTFIRFHCHTAWTEYGRWCGNSMKWCTSQIRVFTLAGFIHLSMVVLILLRRMINSSHYGEGCRMNCTIIIQQQLVRCLIYIHFVLENPIQLPRGYTKRIKTTR